MRNKMIELICEAVRENNCEAHCDCNCIKVEIIADYLIANGVTLATDINDGCKWIPVSERLPTEEEDRNRSLVGVVNGHKGNVCFVGAHIFVRYSHEEKSWWSEDYDIEGCKVLYWMPLPEPPKENE